MMRSRGSRAFSFYLAGQWISNLGDSFRFVAVTVLIYKLTGSGMEAAAGLALSTLPSILASPFAGVLGDRLDEKRLLILIDFLRFLTAPLFLFVDNVLQIYLLLILLSLSDIFYNPSRKKFILGMTGREGALKANSYLTGIAGAAYLVGPLTAGFLTDAYGTAPAIVTASVCCLFSCLLTLAAGLIYGNSALNGRNGNGRVYYSSKKHSMSDELRKGFAYCKSEPDVRALLIIGIVAGFCTISVNLAFYPYAFDLLKVTARGWSLMITVYYGTNLLAMLLLKYIGINVKRHDGMLFYGGLCIVSVIWALYTIVNNFAGVLLLQFTEGTIIAVCGILLASRFQTITDKNYMARVSGMSDIFSNVGKIFGMGCSVLLAGRFSYLSVFIVNSILMFLFAVYGSLHSRWARNSAVPTIKI